MYGFTLFQKQPWIKSNHVLGLKERMIWKKNFNRKGSYIQRALTICAFMYIETFHSTNNPEIFIWGFCVFCKGTKNIKSSRNLLQIKQHRKNFNLILSELMIHCFSYFVTWIWSMCLFVPFISLEFAPDFF